MPLSCKKGKFDWWFNRLDRPVKESLQPVPVYPTGFHLCYSCFPLTWPKFVSHSGFNLLTQSHTNVLKKSSTKRQKNHHVLLDCAGHSKPDLKHLWNESGVLFVVGRRAGSAPVSGATRGLSVTRSSSLILGKKISSASKTRFYLQFDFGEDHEKYVLFLFRWKQISKGFHRKLIAFYAVVFCFFPEIFVPQGAIFGALHLVDDL